MDADLAKDAAAVVDATTDGRVIAELDTSEEVACPTMS
jgi:hypothetical protein